MMNMKNYIVIRLANKADGTFAAPVASYENKADAMKEYYRLCGQAVDSTHLCDTVMLVDKYGKAVIAPETFEHPAN